MALFGKKKPADADGVETPDGDAPEQDFVPQPDKARKWFEHAKGQADSSQYLAAMQYYANGIKLDPGAMSAHEALFKLAALHLQKEGKPAKSKDIKSVDGPTPVARMAAAEFAWGCNYLSTSLAVKTLEAAIKASQLEFGHFAAKNALAVLKASKKPSKSQFLSLMELCKQVESWDEAMAAGAAALALDPSNSDLDSDLKDLSAQRAMSQGGYEQAAGKEGGFRDFVKDADKQREREEEESLAGVGGGSDRVLARARAEYEKSPETPDLLNKYAQLLVREGSVESLDEADAVYVKGHEDTGEYRFRMNAGDIRIKKLRDAEAVSKAAAQAAPGDEAIGRELEAARQARLLLELEEFRERAGHYPTDRVIKYRLGELAIEQGEYDLAMECFQKSKDEPKLRVRSTHQLGRCFAHEGWHAEAIAEFNEALATIDATEGERELEIRYDLMSSLLDQGRLESAIDVVREALEICSSIARKDITYRDIRAKRKEIDALVRELS